MDRGIWAIWYDLEGDGRAEYFDWLHGTHLPALMARPGYVWAASYEVVNNPPRVGDRIYDPERDGVGLGGGKDLGLATRFIQLVGAADTGVFSMPPVDTIPEVQSADAQAMLAMRKETRSAILLEEARVNGPDFAARPVATAPGPVIQMGALRLNSLTAQFALGAWYANDRMPATTRAAGSVGMRKFAVTAGWAKHAVIYEFASVEARDEVMAHVNHGQSEAENERMMFVMSSTLHAPGSPAVARRMWPE